MSATSFASAIALAATMAAGVGITGAAAQGVAIPAEFPPSSYTGTQYVDSKGCAFVRAGMDGRVNWVPRVNRAREQLCNFQPTTTRTAAAPMPDPLPNVPIITVNNTPAPVAAPAPRAATPSASAPARVAAAAPAAAAPTIRAATPSATVQPATARVVSPPAPRRITLAEACEGKSGVQRGYISASTGQPIDCGGAPRVAAVMQPPLVAAGPAPLRLTLAAACAQQVATGRTLINAATRQPIVCDVLAATVVASVPQARVAAPTVASASACGIDGFNSDGRYPVRCGPQALSPSGGATALASAALPRTATVSTRTAKPLFGAGPVPASNIPASRVTVPNGYAQVWDDGRINHQRGLPKTQARISSRSVAPAAVQAPAAATTGHRYVQVGSFGDPANAARLIARLQAAGLPVASAKSGSVKVIAAGPFRSAADLNRALGMVRGMGFADAYLRS
jgi:hypothetical protein